MLNRFEGEAGIRLRVEAFAAQKIVAGNMSLANELAKRTVLSAVKSGDILIEQGATDNDLYFILAGLFKIVVNGKPVQKRGPGETVGEMASLEPIQKRSASVIAVEDSVVAKLAEPDLAQLGSRFPDIWRILAKELAKRLLQRNALIREPHSRTRVFIISSTEGLPIARAIQNALAHDSIVTVVWADGVFRVTNYTLQTLEDEVDQSDFAVAIAHADDITASRGKEWPSPRDNVVFELGLFMGRLGRHRAILMEPRDEKVKLPSDMAGITTIPYRFEVGRDTAAVMAPACNALRDHINRLGPNN